ncbi:protein DnaK [Seminavis robusta]|uniref:Protein DnaK n=1 Tax=Seminavis robusta TaxID=568900 RepID=A0A9N8EWX0_9STRA|nr:protein DnaK [Seminavis robusta]|eukprot:Sro1845_g301270.1 protein DnaK (592) ;mRNA; f:10113-11888
MPSVVTQSEQAVLVGRQAIALEAEQGSYRNVKRILGRGAHAAQESLEVVPFLFANQQNREDNNTAKKNKKKKHKKKKKVDSLSNQIKDAQENPAMLLSSVDQQSSILPAEISAHILRKLIETAEEHAQQKVTRAVIGVPAYFHDEQRDATIQAANLAGIDKVKLLREPEAAALAYGVGRQQQLTRTVEKLNNDDDDDDDDELVLVFDLGGGTYDVSMLLVGGGLTEIITTSGDSQLGGSDFDAKVAQHMRQVLAIHGLTLSSSNRKGRSTDPCSATDAIVRSAEMVRIYLSNNKRVRMALPLQEDAWSHMPHASDIIKPLDFQLDDDDDKPVTAEGVSNTTHVLCELTRRDMERMCQEQFLALLRPIREVAIMAGALLPGDTSPTIVEAAMQMEEEFSSSLMFEDFYDEESLDKKEDPTSDDSDIDETILLQLQDGLDETSVKAQKRAQQRGRKKARDVTKRERKFRQEKRKLAEETPAADVTDTKVRDGISGRPISRVVLVGGATRMPAIGRLLAALTGVVPQKTVNPDEAVALGCAVHVGVLDGKEDMGTVLNPMQAAILRAVAEQQQQQGLLSSDEFDEEEFDSVEYF